MFEIKKNIIGRDVEKEYEMSEISRTRWRGIVVMRARVDTTSEHAISSADVAVTFKSESTVEFLKIIFQPSSKYLLRGGSEDSIERITFGTESFFVILETLLWKERFLKFRMSFFFLNK